MLDLVVENKLILCAKTGITQNILSVYIIKGEGMVSISHICMLVNAFNNTCL